MFNSAMFISALRERAFPVPDIAKTCVNLFFRGIFDCPKVHPDYG